MRSISALVDVTNYVMLELGQPLHAFDDAELRRRDPRALPETGRTSCCCSTSRRSRPTADTALIADEAKPLALAGIMGGEHSGIGDTTTDLFLESAFFTPTAIAGKARALGFSSDASHRYERGVDFELQRRAIERATQLILDICGGQPGPVIEAVSPDASAGAPAGAAAHAACRPRAGHRLVGRADRQAAAGLGVACERQGDEFVVTPPSLSLRHRDRGRPDRGSRPPARLRQHSRAAAHGAAGHAAAAGRTARRRWRVRHLLAERDYHEVVTFSFVEAGMGSRLRRQCRAHRAGQSHRQPDGRDALHA